MQNEGILVFALVCWAAALIFFFYSIHISFKEGDPFFILGLMLLFVVSFGVFCIKKKEETVKITLSGHPDKWYKCTDSEAYFFYCPGFMHAMGPYAKPEIYQVASWNYFDHKKVRYIDVNEK